jgi:hypothetical protein
MDKPIVYKIDINEKYAICFEAVFSEYDFQKIKDTIREWLKSDDPFLILHGNVKLVKVDEKVEF